MAYEVELLLTEFVTHDTKRYVVEKPEGYEFTPGQATEVAMAEEGWEAEWRPFTFTNLPDEAVLEFIIKSYPADHPDHDGMTERLGTLEAGARLKIKDPWGTIQYKGPGVFIAGGAGVTPFIAIFRDLKKKGEVNGNSLLFSNKKKEDVILEKEWREMLDEEHLVLTLTQEEVDGYGQGRIDESLLKRQVDDFSQPFYVCGPPPMVGAVKEMLAELGAKMDKIVFEK